MQQEKGWLLSRKGSGRASAVLILLGAWSALLTIAPAMAADPGDAGAPRLRGVPADCPRCAEWTLPQMPFRVYGNTYYVGTHGLSSILITSPRGHILIDGTVQEGAAQIAANVRALGFRVEDIHLILNSHVHFDHAGGIAALQKASGAQVAASASSAQVLMQGQASPDDPQLALHSRAPTPIAQVRILRDGETVTVGPLALTAHFTPGHTPGGTSWSWQSCEKDRCLHMVYADSLTPVSAEGFQFSHNPTYPTALQDFARSFATLSALPCDILLTPHPEASDLWGRLTLRDAGSHPDAFVAPDACRRYVARSRQDLVERLSQEKRQRAP